MESNFISINGLKIFYIQKNSTATNTIFFLHGNSTNHLTWEKQLNDDTLASFRLIAFDLPAHGSSDAFLNESEYTLPKLAIYMAAAIKQLSNGQPFILTGISLGTNIIAEMMALDLNPCGLLLAGPFIIGQQQTPDKFVIPNTKSYISFVDEPSEEDLMALIKLSTNKEDQETEQNIISGYKAVKGNFRSHIGQSVADGLYSDQIALIRNKNVPTLIIFGADDKAIHPDYLDGVDMPLWENKILKFEHAGHLVNLDEAALFTQVLSRFAQALFKVADS